MRRQPYTVRTGDRCKVRHYKGEVLITLVLVLDVMLLAIIYTVACVYSKWFRVKYLISVTDLINRIIQILKGDLYWFKISTQDTGLMEPVKP